MLYQSLFLIIALWLSVVSASVPIPLQSCATGSDIVTGISATANVWPPVKGQEFTVDLSATITKDINGGTYELKVAFDTIPLIDKTGPLTDLNITLPIKAGPLSLSKSVQFPNIPISGAIAITIKANDSNGNEIVCEQISLNLAAKKPIQTKAVTIPYTSCASGTDLATLSQVTANEWPPVKGTDLIITLYGTLSKAVTNGTYEIKAVFDGILPVLDQKGELSALTTLPLPAGPITVSKTQNLPSIIPSGSLEITITATSDDGEQILCIKVDVTIAAPVATKAVTIPYTSCASGTDLATLSQVTANEWPPVKGTDLIITLYGTLSKAVTNGTYEIKAVFDGILPVLDQKGELSALTTLPLPAGPITVSKTQNLPSIIPSGSLEITITATSDDGEQILCIKVDVTIAAPVPAIKVANVPVPYDSCGSSSDIGTLDSVTANEWPPVTNSDLSLTATGHLSQSVTSGTYEIKGKFDGITVLKKHGNLSDIATLPLSVGFFSISKTIHLSKKTPKVKIELEVTATNGDGTQIICFKASVHIKSPAPTPALPHRPVSHGFPIIVSPFKVVSNVPLPSSDFSNCGTSADLMPFVSVSASSWPPVAGSSLEMTTTFDAKESVTGGTYHYKAEYMGIVVQDKSDTLANAGFKVPISTGAYAVTQTVTAPSGLPAGHIVTTTSATDQNGKQLFCFVIQFDI